MEKLMYRVSRSYLSNDEDAADAVQDTLSKAGKNALPCVIPGSSSRG